MCKRIESIRNRIKNHNEKDQALLDIGRKKWANMIFALIMISFITLAFFAYFGLLDRTFDYRIATTNHPIIITLPNHENKTVNLRSIVSLHTTALSAQNIIRVDMRLEPEPEDMKNKVYDWNLLKGQKYHLAIFGGSIVQPEVVRENGEYAVGGIPLEWHENPPSYSGTGKIVYQFDDTYGYFYMTQSEIEQNYKDGVVIIDSNKYKHRINNATKFPVGSSEQTYTLRNNDLILCLTLVFALIGTIEIKKWLSFILVNAMNYWHNHVCLRKIKSQSKQ